MRKEWTTQEIALLKQLIAQGKDRYEIAEILGRTYSSVANRICLLKIKTKRRIIERKVYAVYKQDQYIASGTVTELAEKLNIKRRTVQWYLTNTYLKRSGENAIRFVEVE